MTRTTRSVFLLIAAAAAFAGCSPLPPAPFTLTMMDGAELPLYPDSRLAEGAEAVIGGSGKASVLYSLKDSVRFEHARPALEIRYTLSGSARIEIHAEGSRKNPIFSLELAQGPGELRWMIPLTEGAVLAALRFTALPGNSEADKSSLTILGLTVCEAEYGFERYPRGARFSRGSVLLRNEAAAAESIRVEHPYLASDNPRVELLAKECTVRLHTSEGRTAVISFSDGGTSILPLAALGGGSIVTAEITPPGALERLSIRTKQERDAPLAMDLATLLAIPEPEDPKALYSLYRWSVLPETLIFDFRDYAVQDAYLKRLAFFVEKEGFRGRLASDAEIANLHGWNAHDYRAEDLAAFFDKAERAAFPLSVEETELKGILAEHGILVREGGRVRPGRGAFISISRESSPYLRRLFINHEASHALFFQDERYRRLAESLWKSHGAEERRFWNVFLSNRDYDPGDVYLSFNEFQAYMVQQPLSQLESWLRDIAYARLAKSYPDRAAAILEDLEAAIPGYRTRAAALDAYLRETYGLRAGVLERIRFE